MALSLSPLEIGDVILIKPDKHVDERGFFIEMFKYTDYSNSKLPTEFVQDNLVHSKKNVLRGKFRNTSRSRVERYLINRVKNVYKNMIVSLDDSFVDNSGVKMWKDKVF